MERRYTSSSLPDFLASPIESLRHSLSSLPSSSFSPSSSTVPPAPPPLLSPTNPSLLNSNLPAYHTARHQYTTALTAHKLHRAIHTLHNDTFSTLLGNERQQRTAVGGLVGRESEREVGVGVASGVEGCVEGAGVMDGLLGELVVRLKALDGVVDRLPPLNAYTPTPPPPQLAATLQSSSET